MPPQRPPSSPTSLLWSHQLKREHGLLLNRMKRLEEEIAGVKSRTQEAAGTARADDVAAIIRQVQRLTDEGCHAATEKIRGEVMERFGEFGTEMKAVTVQVSNLEHGQEGLRKEGRRAGEGEKVLLKRIQELEGSVGDYERGVLKLGRRIDDLAIGKIREALDGLKEDVKGERVVLEMVQASLGKLGEAGKVLREGNERLAEQVKELAKKPVTVPVLEPAVITTDHTEPINVPQKLDQEESSTQTPLPAQKSKATKKMTAKATPKASRKLAPRRVAAKTQPASTRGVAAIENAAKDSHKPQIDERLKKPIIRRGRGWIEVEEEPDEEEDEVEPNTSVIIQPAKRRGRPPKVAAPPVGGGSASTAVPPVKRGPGRPRKDATQANPPPRRSIAQSAVEAKQAASDMPPPKRGPGRPRKNASQAAPTSTSRRTIIQVDETQPSARNSHLKRTIEEVDSEAPEAYDQQKLKTTGTPEQAPKRLRRGSTNIFTSPLSSSNSPVMRSIESVPDWSRPRHVFQSDPSQRTLGVDNDSIEVQPAKRRKIVQMDDMGN